ncbi:MAG: glycosyltransferase [Candidatus Velthaea sp.]|jgi:GT2 family glycosyltransferase
MPTGIRVFGERARLWSASLPPGAGAIVADEGNFAGALRAAADERLAGGTFFGSPMLADLRADYVRRRALGVFASGTLDEQIAALDALAAESLRPEIISATPELQRGSELRVLRDFLLASDALLLRSFGELRRLRELLPAISYQRVSVLGGPASWIPPAAAGTTRDLVVVWAPHLDARSLALETVALVLAKRPAAVICRAGQLDGLGVTFAPLAGASDLLARARLVIVVDAYDGGPAVTFAARGHAVAVAFTNGALEELDGLRAFDPVNLGSLRAAIEAGWNDAPARPREPAAGAVPFIVPLDGRAATARQLGRTAWNLAASYDLRREPFDRITGGCAQLAPAATMDRQTVAQAVKERACLRVRSLREIERVQVALGFLLPAVTIDPPRDERVPATIVAAQHRDAIVVWAPDLQLDDLTVVLMGLHYERRPVIVVCAGGTLPGANVSVVQLSGAAEALGRALLCVDGDPESPAAALALARLGIPLVVASTSGADEWLDRIGVYDPWDHLSVAAAVGVEKYTLGPLSPRRIGPAALAHRMSAYLDEIALDGPLVSVVLLTRNRRNFLRRALESVAAQRYRNIEIIVVRNGGVLVDDIVEAVPGARVLNSEENLGVNPGLNLGTRDARGEYIAYLADDDAYLPEHIGSCVGALERTGAVFAHGGMLAVDLLADGKGGYDIMGYSLENDRPAEVGSMYSMNAVATPAMLIRRADLAATGNWNEALGAMADYELAMRFMQQGELIYVNRPTIVQTYRRADKTQYSSARGDETLGTLELLYRTHPIEGQPWVEKSRVYWRERFAQHQAGGSATPLWFPVPAVTFEPVPYSAADEP